MRVADRLLTPSSEHWKFLKKWASGGLIPPFSRHPQLLRAIETKRFGWAVFEKLHFLAFSMENWSLILQVLKVSSLDNNFWWHFLIDKMFSQDRQMIVDGFRHQNFCIWTIFGWVMGVLMKIITKTTLNAVIRANKLYFH